MKESYLHSSDSIECGSLLRAAFADCICAGTSMTKGFENLIINFLIRLNI